MELRKYNSPENVRKSNSHANPVEWELPHIWKLSTDGSCGSSIFQRDLSLIEHTMSIVHAMTYAERQRSVTQKKEPTKWRPKYQK